MLDAVCPQMSKFPVSVITYLLHDHYSWHFQYLGSIHRPEFREFWETSLRPTGLTLETIRHGYRLPFRDLPPSCREGNNRSARDDSEFVYAEIMRLEKLKCITRVDANNIPHCVLPLSSIVSRKKVSVHILFSLITLSWSASFAEGCCWCIKTSQPVFVEKACPVTRSSRCQWRSLTWNVFCDWRSRLR